MKFMIFRGETPFACVTGEKIDIKLLDEGAICQAVKE